MFLVHSLLCMHGFTCDMAKGIMHCFKPCLIEKSVFNVSKSPPSVSLVTIVAVQ